MKLKRKQNIVALLIVLIIGAILILNYNSNYSTVSAIQNESKEKIVIREPVVAGMFYPAQKEELKAMIDNYLNKARVDNIENIRGIVSPHAGYIYSGPVAAYGYKAIKGKSYKTVIILSPSHHAFFYGASIPDVTHYKTPLGLVKLSPKVEQLRKEKIIVSVPQAHPQEHSVEVQIPFLQAVLKDFEIIPIVVGNVNPEELASMLINYIDNSTLIIASSDLSHYHPYNVAVSLDKNCIEAIPSLDFENMDKCEACGKLPILTLMHIAKHFGWRGKLLDYRNSGDTVGDKRAVVGYMSSIFYED
jgi:hypothetical protein